MTTTRRTFLRSAGAAIAAPAVAHVALGPRRAAAQPLERSWRHGLALFGDLKYPPQFAHFDYVNPQAPRGGTVRLSATGTFDNFNLVVAGVKGQLAARVDGLYETLLTPSLDEESSAYGLLAEAVSYPPDRASVTYRLRAEAKWHDGRPVTPDDVIFSFTALKTNHPQYSAYYRRVTKAEQTGDREVTFTFDAPGIRELPQIVSEFPILPKHWWEASDAAGRRRNVAETTLEPPLGSGPYRIKTFEAGRTITFERAANYWGKDLNVRAGHDNFGELRLDYFRDTDVEFSKPSRAIRSTCKLRPPRRTGRPATAFRRCGTSASCWRNFPSTIPAPCSASRSICGGRSFATHVCVAPSISRSISRPSTARFSSANTSALRAFSMAPTSPARGCRRAANWKSLKRCGDVLRPTYRGTFSPRPTPIRSAATPRRCARICARRRGCLEAAGYVVRGLKLVDTKTGSRWRPNSCCPIRAMNGSPCSMLETLKRLGVQVTIWTVDDAQYEGRGGGDAITTS